MTLISAYQIFGSMALALLGGLLGFLIKRNTYEVAIKGRVEALERWQSDTSQVIERYKSNEGRDAIRQYRQDENDKKLAEISRQIESGFDKMSGAINAINLQMVEVVAKAANTDASLKQAWNRIAGMENALEELRRAIVEIQKELRGMKYKEDEA